jgi:hypothetical protein
MVPWKFDQPLCAINRVVNAADGRGRFSRVVSFEQDEKEANLL